jgi:energy-coupling factor transporter transmembrane protein EcfT
MRVDLENNLTLAPGSPFGQQDPVITVIAMAILVPVCFWVYFDASQRYRAPWAPLLWAVLVFLVLIFFLPMYLMTRPPKKSPAGRQNA